MTGSITCSGPGLIIGANAITLNCAGYSITGTPSIPGGIPYAGIAIKSFTAVTVENCNVFGFSIGFNLTGATSTLVTANTDNGDCGYCITGGSDNILLGDTALNVQEPACCSYISATGIVLTSTTRNTVVNNNVVDTFTGLSLSSSSNNNLTRNTTNAFCCGFEISSSSYNTFDSDAHNGLLYPYECLIASGGFILSNQSTHNVFTRNTVKGVGAGFTLSFSPFNLMNGNTVSQNCIGFSLDSSSNSTIIVSNTANNNARYGFSISGSVHNTLDLNTAINTGGDGFFMASSASLNTLGSNTANYNAGYGFTDQSSGLGTAGTANGYVADTCIGNAAGGSQPPGLCSSLPLRLTMTTVACSPPTVPVNQATTCTATVTDTSPTPTPPTRTVTFTSTSPGSFTPANNCTLVPDSTSTSKCSVTYTPAAAGAHTILAIYGGDPTHQGSTGTTVVTVTPACREADGNGDFHGSNGKGNFHADDDQCEDGIPNQVSSTNVGDGKDFQSTQISMTTFDSVANMVTITGFGTHGGVPVSFTFVALATGPTTPGWVSFAFSDGYTNAGTLTSGDVVLS